MNAKEFQNLLNELDACHEAIEWSKGKDFLTVWKTCQRGDWMLWLAKKMQNKDGWPDLRNLTLAKALCAKTVIHLMKDERSKKAIEVAENYGLNKASEKELSAYAAAAAAADADADADAYADAAADAAAAAAYADADAAAAYAAADAAADAAAAAYAAAYADAAAAAAAAYAAAAYAAADDARYNTLKKCANICRETLNVPLGKYPVANN